MTDEAVFYIIDFYLNVLAGGLVYGFFIGILVYLFSIVK